MTATEPQIVVHDELSIDPKPVIAPDAIQLVPAESRRRGREFRVYKVPSRSLNTDRTVVWNDKTRVIYCDCVAAQYGNQCAHLASVLFLREYERAYREYYDLSTPELEARQRDFTEMERRTLVPVRGWRAQQAAIGDIVHERLEGVA